MQNLYLHFNLFILLLTLPLNSIYSQYLKNPSLDSRNGGEKPYDWHTCGIPGNSPDMISVLSDDYTIKTYTNVDGVDMCLLRTRGVNFTRDDFRDYRRTYEHISSKLEQPLLKENCYKLTIYLCYVSKAKISDLEDPKVTYPLRFQVWGANDSCTFEENFIDSEPIRNESFQKYEFYFSVDEDNYDYIYVRPYWDTINIISEPYSGIMLLDKMTLDHVKPITLPEEKVLYYQRNPAIQIPGPDGQKWKWSPEIYLSAYNIQSPFITDYSDNNNIYRVKVIDNAGCPLYQDFKIEYVCDKVYPNQYFREVPVYFKFKPPVTIKASEGSMYEWDKSFTGLSDYSIQNPEALQYNENFIVEVTENSNYKCKFKEKFNLIANCDTIFPNKSDTTFFSNYDPSKKEKLTLKINDGIVSKPWQPSEFVDCEYCSSIDVEPFRTTLYSVEVENVYPDFSCKHEEHFLVDVELKIPNVITPNDDQLNDVFKIYGLDKNASLRIFDKNGKKVCDESPYTEKNWWSGKDLDGKPLNTGTYWYSINIPGDSEPVTGFIFVKR